ncbi:hypothetical protein MXD81_27055, partial [Microbacteriaceae bacterium K1510]|nr:hypothetical protein [Microbacteriaceae bacterium K1510]
DVIDAIKVLGATDVNLTFGSMTDEERSALSAQLRGGQGQSAVPGQAQPLNPILAKESKTKFIAITSGKGGVGKSTVTVN